MNLTYIGPTFKQLTPLLAPPPASRKLTVQSLPSYGNSTRSPLPDFNWSYHVDIISALKGNTHDHNSRNCVAESIYCLSDDAKIKLIDFIGSTVDFKISVHHGTISSTLENNACKIFNCSPNRLKMVLWLEKRDALRKLYDLWDELQHKIIPNTFGMLYPLEEFDASFELNKVILSHFRDVVLMKIFHTFVPSNQRNGKENSRKLFSMLFLIDIKTMNVSSCEYKLFDKLFRRLMKEEDGQERDYKSSPWPSKVNIQELSSEAQHPGSHLFSAHVNIGEKPTQPEKSSQKANLDMCCSNHKANPLKKAPVEPRLTTVQQSKTAQDTGGLTKIRATTMPSNKSAYWDDETTVHV